MEAGWGMARNEETAFWAGCPAIDGVHQSIVIVKSIQGHCFQIVIV
jgi:hypothetical protein